MGAMKLEVSDIRDNQKIPSEYTCDGIDVSPEVSWGGLPEGTKSLALTLIDPDAPMGDFIHWLVYDIPPEAGKIPRGGPLPAGAKEVESDFGKKSYGGPCPPSGVHRYVFTLYALDAERLEGVSRDNLLQLLKKHKIDSAAVTGLYSRAR